MLAHRLELSTLNCSRVWKNNGREALPMWMKRSIFFIFMLAKSWSIKKQNPSAHSRGVLAVVTPWNFPLAIPCGMVSSALVSGNTVILKSAEQTPLIAQKMVDIFHAAGVPENCLDPPSWSW